VLPDLWGHVFEEATAQQVPYCCRVPEYEILFTSNFVLLNAALDIPV
jgi:hypothetical protein